MNSLKWKRKNMVYECGLNKWGLEIGFGNG